MSELISGKEALIALANGISALISNGIHIACTHFKRRIEK